MTPEQYQKLQSAGYSDQKIKAYARSKGMEAFDPNQKKGFFQTTKEALVDIPSDLGEAFDGAKNAVTEGMDTQKEARQQVIDGDITPAAGTVKTIGGGAKAGAKVVGEAFMAILKAPFSQTSEKKIGDFAGEMGTELAGQVAKDFEELKTSEDPSDQRIAAQIEGLGERYKNDAEFQAKVDGYGGLAVAAAEFFGLGKGGKVVGDGFANLRKVEFESPKLNNLPYFNQREAEIAEGIRQMKLNTQKVNVPENAPTVTAAQEAAKTEPVITLQNQIKLEVQNNINPNKNLDDVITRLDTLIEQGKYKEAVNVANANTKDNILTKITQKTIDAAVISGQKAAETYRVAVDGSTARITGNLDRQALKDTASMDRPDVDRWMSDSYVNAVSPGVKGKKTSLAAIEANKQSAVSAMKKIVLDKDQLEFRDVETNDIITGELPSNLWEFGGAIQDQKKRTYAQIAEKIEATGDGAVDTDRIAEAMREIIDDDVYKSIPQVQNRANQVLEQYDFAEYSIADIERIIQIENDRLQAFYRGSGTQADAVVSAIVANNLRDILDETIENATGEGVKQLKKQYGDLSAIERDVVHRALHNSQAREAGLVDMFGIQTIGDVASGMAGDINALKNSAAQIAGEGFIKALNDRDALTNRMFLVADQTYGATP